MERYLAIRYQSINNTIVAELLLTQSCIFNQPVFLEFTPPEIFRRIKNHWELLVPDFLQVGCLSDIGCILPWLFTDVSGVKHRRTLPITAFPSLKSLVASTYDPPDSNNSYWMYHASAVLSVVAPLHPRPDSLEFTAGSAGKSSRFDCRTGPVSTRTKNSSVCLFA